ncbi:MAG: PHP domain-containing protein [Bacteroidales bacterium]|jgi:predicted metal-dependent phosphoesterase TrpH
MKIDLHIHSEYSIDGISSISEIIEITSGLDYISITDHDSIDAHKDPIASDHPKVITGCEFTCFYENPTNMLHLLAYKFNTNDMLPFFCEYNNIIMNKAEWIIDYFKSHFGINYSIYRLLSDIGVEKLPQNAYQIAEHILAANQNNNGFVNYLNSGNKAGHKYRDVFMDFIHYPEFVAMLNSYNRILELIKSAGGFLVLAHPSKCKSELLYSLLESNTLDGIESEYLAHTSDQRSYYQRLATDYNLFCTAGSDYHGTQGRQKLITSNFKGDTKWLE